MNYVHNSLVQKRSLTVQGGAPGDDGTSIQGAILDAFLMLGSEHGVLTDFTGGLLPTAARWQLTEAFEVMDEDEEAEIFLHFAHQAELKEDERMEFTVSNPDFWVVGNYITSIYMDFDIFSFLKRHIL